MDEERAPEADGDEAEAEGERDWEIDAEGRNPTQQRMDEEGVEEAPVDAPWEGEGEGGPEAPQADAEPTFEPDVPLVAEVNRETGEASDRRRRLGVLGAAGALLAGVALRRRRRRR